MNFYGRKIKGFINYDLTRFFSRNVWVVSGQQTLSNAYVSSSSHLLESSNKWLLKAFFKLFASLGKHRKSSFECQHAVSF